MELEEFRKQIDTNTDRIMHNLEKISENEKNIQKNSLALELLKDYKVTNHRMFLIIIIILFMWLGTIGYLVYVLNDIASVDTTQEIDDVDTIHGNIINNGDMYGEN